VVEKDVSGCRVCAYQQSLESETAIDLELVAELMEAEQEAFELVTMLVTGAMAVPVPA